MESETTTAPKKSLNGVYLFLEKIGSPIVLLANGKAKANDPKKMSLLDLFRAVYVINHPIGDCLALWSQGKEIFDAAVIGWADTLDSSDPEALSEKLLKQIAATIAPKKSE